jgi:hypothetical protein
MLHIHRYIFLWVSLKFFNRKYSAKYFSPLVYILKSSFLSDKLTNGEPNIILFILNIVSSLSFVSRVELLQKMMVKKILISIDEFLNPPPASFCLCYFFYLHDKFVDSWINLLEHRLSFNFWSAQIEKFFEFFLISKLVDVPIGNYILEPFYKSNGMVSPD